LSSECTFIIASNATLEGNDVIERLAGDINLFFNDKDNPSRVEMSVMVAELRYRRCGFATEAINLFMKYATDELGVTYFYCKINKNNPASIDLLNRYVTD
jgi:RimJ/RimL family protein N-acetyltransferase